MEKQHTEYRTIVCDTARRRGRGHIAKETPCQDYCLSFPAGEGLFVLCAADGHGGDEYIYSDLGSELACTTLKTAVERFACGQDLSVFLGLEFRRALLDSWKRAVLDFHGPDSESDLRIARRYGTTLLYAIVSDTEMVLGQLGDGAILMFNDDGVWQLFKRHEPKSGSSTSSMVSSRAVYALHTEKYSRSLFPHVLLSTDGIYDKLDHGDSFLRYGMGLLHDTRSHGELTEPFTVEGIDVFEETHDDCSIALLTSRTGSSLEIPEGMSFVRAWDGITVCSDGTHEAHSTGRPASEVIPDSCAFHVLPAEGTDPYLYTVPEDSVMISELIEEGEHLFKKNRDDDDESPWTNSFWLDLWTRMHRVRDQLRRNQCMPEEHLLKTARVTPDGSLWFFRDAFCGRPYDEAALNALFERFFERFSFIGILSLGDRVWPLTETGSRSQIFTFRNEPLCRLVRNSDSGQYGLWNLTETPWIIPATGKIIAPNKVLKLPEEHPADIGDTEHTTLSAVIFGKGELPC
ncbi:MAG: protein phosphatase 2C domain-containing protein [Solobacterium sp.]|nr:protein phosphatase 2C domain-containing protein [Solobacterium sp.]